MNNWSRNVYTSSSRRILRILSSMIIILFFVGPSTIVSGQGAILISANNPEPLQVSAISGNTAELPCDVSPRHPNDSVLLVVWYRDDTPIYSWDARSGLSGMEGGGEGGAHWSGVEGGGRARWSASSARLSLQPTRPKDRGEYRCRADFRASQTRNTKVHLQVIEAANQPRIFDERGSEIRGGAGPYREGDAPQLVCNVTGGYPPATVRWYRGGTAVEGQGSQTGVLRLPPLRRSDLSAELSCQASNSPLLPPTTATVQLEMHLPPLNAKVLEREPLSAGRPQEIICRARGGRPPPKLSWWLDGQRLDAPPQEDTEGETNGEKIDADDENKEASEKMSVSISTLKFVARAQQHGQRLMCRAAHPLLASPLEAILTLNVLFAPTVELALGTTLNPNDIEEGDDVYFECQVRANPPPYKLVWEHDGKALVHDPKSGVLLSNNNLVLRSVGRAAAGAYACSASNVEGDARSQIVNLRIMYKPICSINLRRSYGVARKEHAQLLCEVEAVPPPDTFYWALNHSMGQLTEVLPERYTWTSSPARSTLTYTPLSDEDYGTALCWATNLVGKQVVPCAVSLMPASRPHPPANCSLTNQTSAALEIICDPGYDGGLQQTFFLEVYERSHDNLLVNLSYSRPIFAVDNLEAGITLKLFVYAANSRGRSDPVSLDAYTLELAEPHTGNVSNIELTSLIGMLIGAITTTILLFIIFLVIFKIKHKMSSDYTLQSGKQKNHCTRSLQPRAQILTLQDDKNPDVVPLNKAEHKLTLEEPSTEIENNLGSGGSFVGPSHPPPYSSCITTTHLTHTSTVPTVETRSRAGREVVTTRAPLPGAQESDV